MTRLFRGGHFGRELPRPDWLARVLVILGLATWVLTVAVVVYEIVLAAAAPEAGAVDALPEATGLLGVALGSAGTTCLVLMLLAQLAIGGVVGGLALAAGLVLKFTFSGAVSSKLVERSLRELVQREVAAGAAAPAGASHEEVVSLLAEIMENTLLDDADKAAKRTLAKKHRQQTLRREIEALVDAGKYREAQQRLEEFRARYASSGHEVEAMEARLSEALRQQEQTEIARVTEQVERYMGLGLWERATELARGLAEQYPENPEAARLPETVHVEQKAVDRQEQQRLYREIEHLVGRRHWRQALRAAEGLLENHPDCPEAKTLREQLPELRKNAAILERREWEERITEHIQTGRHREAYDLAVELLQKYPDSPQAEAIRPRIDQLRARAGVIE